MFEPYIERPVAAEFLEQLRIALRSPNLSPLVLHVWGVGGVGKSTLSGRAVESNPQAASAYVEFGRTEGATDPIGVMKALHRELQPRFSGQDAFSKRYNEYFDTIHQLKTESEDGKGAASAEQIATVKKGVVWAAKGIGGLALPELGAETIGMVAGAAVEGAKLALSEKDRLVDLVQRHGATKGKRELQELILAPVPRLTDAFVESLSRWSRQCPILLRLDTYEKAPNEVDDWLWGTLLGNHDGLRNLPLRILVMGRFRVLRKEGWRKLDQDRPDWIKEWPLGKLDPEQTRDYLRRIGITDATEQQQIIQVTKGLPYYLNWIRKERQAGRPLVFAVGNQEIANLLLQGLESSRRRVIELAACCRWFDRRLLESIGQQQSVAADFDWLVQQSFVEQLGFRWRLDDVARDVFRQSFWQIDRDNFERSFDLLMRYFKAQSDQEVSAASAPPDKYENPDWRDLRTEYLYYLLFTRSANLELIWVTHLLEARHFGQDALVQLPLQSLEGEADLDQHPYLSHPTRQFLQKLRPAILHGWAVLEEAPIDYEYNEENFGLTRAATQTAIELCLGKIDDLQGLSKFAALFYRSRRCPEPERFERLMAAKTQAEQIVVKTHPEFSGGLFLWQIGNALSDIGRKEDAISSYDKAIEIKPDFHGAWNNRGNALSAIGRNEDAISSYDKAIEYKPDDHEAWFNRGNALSDIGRKEDAISSYDKAIEFKPDKHEAWNNRGNALSDIGRKEDAITSYDKAIEFKPDYYRAWDNRGDVLVELQQYEAAVASYDQAIAIKSDYRFPHQSRGFALMRLGRYGEALESFDRALELKTDYAEAHYNKACCHALMGDVIEAVDCLSRAIALDPESRELAKTDRDFDAIRGEDWFQAAVEDNE